MAKVLILGGGFAGVLAAERRAKSLGGAHEVTLLSRTSRFVFYPALGRLAFGGCEPDDISYDLLMPVPRSRARARWPARR